MNTVFGQDVKSLHNNTLRYAHAMLKLWIDRGERLRKTNPNPSTEEEIAATKIMENNLEACKQEMRLRGLIKEEQ